MQKLVCRLLILSFACSLTVEASESAEKSLQEAYQSYTAGEKATTVAERKTAFNRALYLYTQLEKEYRPESGDGKLYYNIANSYFQVEEYAQAILNYNKALKLMPRSDAVKQNLSVAQQKAGIPTTTFVSLYEQAFFFHSLLSLPERLQLFFLFAVILLVLISLTFWKPYPRQNLPITIAAICCGAMLLSVLYTAYFSPIEAIVVKSTPLYKDAGEQYATVTELPIFSGNKVQVLAVRNNGEWLKVLAPDGNLGYISHTSVRII